MNPITLWLWAHPWVTYLVFAFYGATIVWAAWGLKKLGKPPVILLLPVP